MADSKKDEPVEVEIKIGRPTKKNDLIEAVACRAAQRGMDQRSIAALCGVAESTFYKWMREDDEFSAKMAQAKAKADLYVTNKLFEQIEKGNVYAIRLYLERRTEEYRPRQEEEQMSDDEKAVLLSQMIAAMQSSIPEPPAVTGGRRNGQANGVR